jgi:hypothetical protein
MMDWFADYGEYGYLCGDIVPCLWLDTGFWLVIEYIEYLWLATTNTYDAIANLLTFQLILGPDHSS